MSFYRPSFMALVTLKVDDRAVLIDPALQTALNLPGIVVTKHAQWLRSELPFNTAVSRRLQPLRCRVRRNSHMVADTCSLTLSWRHLGFDPTVIRGCVVQVFAGTVSHEQYGRGIRTLAAAPERMVNARSVIRSTLENAIFTGFADSIDVDWGMKKTVSFDCRDFTQILLDTKVPTYVLNNPPDFDNYLDLWIAALLDTLPITKGIIDSVKLSGVERINVPRAVDSTAMPTYLKSPKTKKSRARPKLLGQMGYWDFIVDICVGAGFIPKVEGTAIVLRQAKTFLSAESYKDVNFSRVIDGRETHVRRITYGENVRAFKLKRKLGGVEQVPAIRIVSSIWGKPISATWPPEAALKAAAVPSMTPGGDQQAQRILVVPVDATDPKVLLRLAKLVWEIMARQEFSGNIQTSELASDGGDNDDPDLLRISPGDPFEFHIASDSYFRGTGAPHDEVLALHTLEEESIVNAMVLQSNPEEPVLPEDLARYQLVARAISSGQKQKVFRASEIEIDFASTSGIKVSIDFHNFYEVLWSAMKNEALDQFNITSPPYIESVTGTDGGVP